MDGIQPIPVHASSIARDNRFGWLIFDVVHRIKASSPLLRGLTLDKRAFLRQVHADPSLAYRILQGMSHRIRRLNEELSRLKAHQPQELVH